MEKVNKKGQYLSRVRIEVPVEELFAYHHREGAFERLAPPWNQVRLLAKEGGIENGGRVSVEVRAGLIRQVSVFEHFDYIPNRQFCDRQIKGVFVSWEHAHRFEPLSPNASSLTDAIGYQLPKFAFFAGILLRKELTRLFRYRYATAINDMKLLMHFKNKGLTPKKIVIAGASGLIGSALKVFLTTQGHDVKNLVRSKGTPGIFWDPGKGEVQVEELEGADVFINLCGENIAKQRWTESHKKKILDSRLEATKTLLDAIRRMKNPPKLWINSSAVGFYGSRGDELLDESASKGRGFLADVCEILENSAYPAEEKGVRVVFLRTGVVLSPRGGALAKMLTPFKMGLGGAIGSGAQWMSWIGIDDMLGLILAIMADESIKGPVNAVSPKPVTNLEFAKTLGKVLNRPAIFPLPAPIARAAFGQMADEALLSSQKVHPKKLLDAGYPFLFPDLEGALRHVLGR